MNHYPKTTLRGTRRHTSGSVLLLVVIVSALVMLLSVSSLRLTSFGSRMNERSHNYHRALNLAEAGLERAINELNQGAVGAMNFSATETVTDHDGNAIGQFIVTIADIGSGVPVIESTGYIPSASNPSVSRTVRVNAQVNLGPAYFDWAIFSYEYLHFGTSYFINSFNSTEAHHPSEVDLPSHGQIGQHGFVNTYANIGTLGSVNMGGNVHIYGSMEAAGAAPTTMPTLHGDDAEDNANEFIANSSPTSPPPYPDDELTAAQGSNNNANIRIFKTQNGQEMAWNGGTDLTVASNRTIVMPPGVYYFTSIDLASNVEIVVSPPGAVKVFVRAPSAAASAIDIDSNSWVNANTALARNFTFFVKQGTVEIASNAVIFAGLFAPDSDVVLQSNFDYYGAIVAGSFSMATSQNFHYDEALGDPAGAAGGVLVLSWVEVTPHE